MKAGHALRRLSESWKSLKKINGKKYKDSEENVTSGWKDKKHAIRKIEIATNDP